MEQITDEQPIQESISIIYNIELLKWYFETHKDINGDDDKQRIFSIFSYSMIEEPYIFMRILLYIANTRHTDEQEIAFKTLVIFLGTMFPELCMANLDLFMKLGKKDDILFFMQCPNISARVIKYVKHKVKEDADFQILLDGTIIDKPIKRIVRYKPKMKKGHSWSVFLNKILDDPAFNGITI